jgi:hypothetical protein
MEKNNNKLKNKIQNDLKLKACEKGRHVLARAFVELA